jgi:hypothetical protein
MIYPKSYGSAHVHYSLFKWISKPLPLFIPNSQKCLITFTAHYDASKVVIDHGAIKPSVHHTDLIWSPHFLYFSSTIKGPGARGNAIYIRILFANYQIHHAIY